MPSDLKFPMLVTSSSNPVAQSLFPGSPQREFDTSSNSQRIPHEHSSNRISVIHGLHHLSSFSCNSSPISRSSSGSCFSPKRSNLGSKIFRRAQSDSNLQGLNSSSFDLGELYSSGISRRPLDNHQTSMLHTEPSFCIYTNNDEVEANILKQELESEELVNSDGEMQRSATIGDRIDALGSGEFSFVRSASAMRLIEEDEKEEGGEEEDDGLNGLKDLAIEERSEIHLASGSGIVGSDGGFPIDFSPSGLHDCDNLEDYYQRMVREEPSNPLFLRNYAQLLQSKGDLVEAADYYFLAASADPKDGDILTQCAKLVWKLHRDKNRALSYFERAIHAAPEDSYVLASYASFLWENGDEDEENHLLNDGKVVEESNRELLIEKSLEQEEAPINSPLYLAAGIGVLGGDSSSIDYSALALERSSSIEKHYRRMAEEDPCNPLVLRNYAQFLCQTKGDLQGAEEYYSRAILADPSDGEIISQYANLVWQLHRDKDKAASYFEQAVHASPEDSYVAAAYARFLWETGEDVDGSSLEEDLDHIPVLSRSTTLANA